MLRIVLGVAPRPAQVGVGANTDCLPSLESRAYERPRPLDVVNVAFSACLPPFQEHVILIKSWSFPSSLPFYISLSLSLSLSLPLCVSLSLSLSLSSRLSQNLCGKRFSSVAKSGGSAAAFVLLLALAQTCSCRSPGPLKLLEL